MSDTKVSAITAASDLVSAVLVGETSGVNKSYPIALFDTRYQASSANLTSWAAITRATGFDTFVATPSSANFASLITDETGTGKVVLATSPTFTTGMTINNNSASLPSPIAGTVVQIGGADATQSRLLFDAFGSNGNFSFRTSLGTAASRSALTTGTIIGSIAGFGAYDTTNYSTTGRVTITYNAAENWDSTHNGTYMQFFTTPNATTAQAAVGTWNNDGLLTVTSFGRGAPVTKTADFTVAASENWLINNKSGSTCTVTLPTASTVTGREIMIKNLQAQTVVSASSNVVGITGGAAGTAILASGSGKWATLVSDGTNWIMMQTG